MKTSLVFLIILTFICLSFEKNLRHLREHEYVKDSYLHQKIKKSFIADKNMANVLKNIGCPDNAIQSYAEPFKYQRLLKSGDRIFVEKCTLEISNGKADFFYASIYIILKPEYAELEKSKLEKDLEGYINGSFYSIYNSGF